MKDFVRNHRKLAAIMGVVIVVVAAWMLSDATAFIQGESLARVDIARGRYVELGYGLPAPWVPEYTRLLRERYGVEHRPVAGCLVSKSLVSFVRAYNSVSTAAAKRRFGHDIFKESCNDAKRNWEQKILNRYPAPEPRHSVTPTNGSSDHANKVQNSLQLILDKAP
jgi:hypothetical protein